MSSAAEHLEACHPCRYGVNCIEWYRLHDRAPDWCELCGAEHFSSHAEAMTVWMDAVTATAIDHEDGSTTVFRTFVGMYFPIAGSLSAPPVASLNGEHVEWIRGHHAHDSPQAKALLVAAALAA